MRRSFTQRAEVPERGHDARSEVMMPHRVHQHARGQRMQAVREHSGEGQTPARRAAAGVARGNGAGDRPEHAQAARGDLLAWLLAISPMEEEGVHLLARILGQAMHHRIHWLGGAEFGRPLANRFHLLGPFLVDLAEDDVILEGRILAEQFLVLLGPFVRRRASRGDHRLAHLLGHQQELFLDKLLNQLVVELLGFSIDELCRLLDAFRQLAIFLGHERDQSLAGILPVLPIEGRLEHGAQPIVIALRNRVVAMIVALRALDGQSQQRRGDDLQRIRDDLIAREVSIRRTVARRIGCQPKKTRGDEFVEILVGEIGEGRRHEFVARKLFRDELVERFVRVERADDVVAITPSPAAFGIRLRPAVRVRVAGHVQPVPRPPFAVASRSQQAIHELLVSVWRSIRQESSDFLGRRRQAGEIMGDPTNQRALVRRRSEAQRFGFERGQDECIDGCAN